jgi:predicted nucleotidyltransferase
LQRYVSALRESLPADVVAVLLTGSLATGSYLPGRDIDQMTILRDDAPAGAEQAAAAALSASLDADYVVHVAPVVYRRGQLEPTLFD